MIFPRRRSKNGTRPGPTTAELYRRREVNEEGEDVETETKWRTVRKVLTAEDKRRLLRKTIEIAIKILMKNHIYQFEGKNKIQKAGGSIGLSATGVIARIRMNRWTGRFKKMCSDNGLKILLFKVYVDDENILWKVMRRGKRWNGTEIEWKREWEEEDMEKDEPHDRRMMREVQKMANTVEEDLQFTVDIPSDNGDQKLPVLDLKMWIEKKKNGEGKEYVEVVHEYYEKTMVSDKMIMKESALPTKMKMKSLTQEVIRMMRNTSVSIREEKRPVLMSRMSYKLKKSGYNKEERKEIILAGLKGFRKLEELERRGIRSVNRSRKENFGRRLLKKHNAKKTWYKGTKRKELEVGKRDKEWREVGRTATERIEDREEV